MENEIPLAELPELTEWPECWKGAFPMEWPDWSLANGPLPRKLRNAHIEAHRVLSKLDNFAVEEWGLGIGQFTQNFFLPLWILNLDPDESRNKWSAQIKGGEHPSMVAVEIATVMCASAFRAYSSGKTELAWTYAIDAEEWCGTLFAGTTVMLGRAQGVSHKASQAAKSKNYKVRAWVLTEWNNRTNKDQVKAAFARQYVPLVKEKFKLIVTTETISRDWLPKA